MSFGVRTVSTFSLSERRKIERRIRRLEKQQRAASGQAQEAEVAEQLSKLKEDLEYVRVSYIFCIFYHLFSDE